ncbi:MAG: hypothetical protein H6719_34070 [Sandaracinaceae bacterium]|nr:hypothetical protein [Sandaracinaceae bacterium]
MRLAPLASALLLAACGAGAPTFADCADDLDCADAADTCYRLLFDRTDGTSADGNLCTHECATDADCGADGLCIALDGDPSASFLCARRCTVSADCYADFVCTPLDGAMDLAACLP